MTPFKHGLLCLTAVMFVLTRSSIGLMSIRTDEGLVNVALNKDIVVANVSDEDVNVVVDGKRSSCIIKDTGHDVWWRVDLGDLHTIFDIRVKPTEKYYSQIYTERDSCYEALRNYEGTMSTTASGRTCQRWDQQTPHKHVFTPEKFWFRENFLKNNYCRVPNDWDMTMPMPWCITTDPKVYSEHCNVWVNECVNVLGKETHIKIGGSLDKMVEIDFKQIEEFDDQNLFWTFLLPSKNNTRYVEFLQNGNAGLLNLCEVEIYGTKEAISNIASFEGSGYKRLVDVEFWPGRYCYHTSYGEKPFWQVDLGDIFIIYLIRIYQWGTLINSDKRSDYELVFWYHPYEKFLKHLNRSSIGDWQHKLLVDSAHVDIVARFIELYTSDDYDALLCEVQLFGLKAECPYNPCKNGGQCSIVNSDDISEHPDFSCQCTESSSGDLCEDCSQNVALKKDTLASSIMHPTWPSSNSVDNDIGQYVGNGATCVATKQELNPYIIIDLGAEFILSSVKFYKQLDLYANDGNEFDIQLLLMGKTWTSYGTFDEAAKLLKPYVRTRLVRLQVAENVPFALRICEIKVFAVCQEGLTPEQVIHDQSKPYMQMRFSLVNKYNEVVKEEAAFIYSIKQELAIATNYSEANFQNMKVQKDPLQVEFELHSTDLKKLSEMVETIDILCGHGMDMMTKDGNNLTIKAGSLQYHVMYRGHAGTPLCSPMFVTVFVLINAISYLY